MTRRRRQATASARRVRSAAQSARGAPRGSRSPAVPGRARRWCREPRSGPDTMAFRATSLRSMAGAPFFDKRTEPPSGVQGASRKSFLPLSPGFPARSPPVRPAPRRNAASGATLRLMKKCNRRRMKCTGLFYVGIVVYRVSKIRAIISKSMGYHSHSRSPARARRERHGCGAFATTGLTCTRIWGCSSPCSGLRRGSACATRARARRGSHIRFAPGTGDQHTAALAAILNGAHVACEDAGTPSRSRRRISESPAGKGRGQQHAP
jgi:hypothetical protein